MNNSLSIFDRMDNMNKMVDDMFSTLGFGMPRNIRFNTGNTKDMLPGYWKEWKDEEGDQRGYKCVCRSVGIAPEDITIELQDDCIVLDGKTEVEDGSVYTQHVELPISKDLMSNIEKVNYRCKDGLTYIYLRVNTPEKKRVLVEKI